MVQKIAFNPKRLAWCCQKYNTDLNSLSKRLKMSSRGLEQANITIAQLRKIAQHFSHGLLFFLEKSNPKEEKILSPQFRTLKNQKPVLGLKIQALIKRSERQRKIYLGLLEDLERPPKNWYPRLLKLERQSPENTAKTIRDWLSLKEGFSFEEMRDAVEKKGVMVIVSNGYKGEWSIDKKYSTRGMSLYFEKLPLIIIKKQSDGAKAFTLLHELAHLLIHRDSFIDEEKDFYSHRNKEKQANHLAANILVPKAFLETISKEKLLQCEAEDYDRFLEDYRKRWCVSTEVILLRFLDLKVLSQEKYESYLDHKKKSPSYKPTGGSRKWRHREPIHIFGKPFVATVLDAFSGEHITLVKASDYLDNLQIKDLHLLESYVLAG